MADGPMFNFTHPMTVYREQEPALYKLAKDAAETSEGTFTYKGKLWQVGEGVTEE